MRLSACLAIIFVILPALAGSAHAQKFDTLWTRIYWGGYFDSTNCVQQTSDDGFIITGVTRAEGQIDTDMHLIKTYPDGMGDWIQVVGTDTTNECGYHVLQTSDGGYLISGQSDTHTFGLGKVWAYKTDANGDYDWEYIFASADPDINGFPMHAIQTSDNGYAITGVININYDNKAFILRLSETGAFVDFDTCSEYSYQDGRFIAQMPDNGFIVAGNFNDPYSTQYDFWAYRTNSSGARLWDSVYVISDYTDIMYGACMVGDGIVMVGVASGESHAHKIDFDGNTIWSKSISKYATGERVTNICQTHDGNLMVAGWIWVSGQRRDFLFTKLNHVLDTLWTFTVGGSQDDHGQWIVPTTDGGFAMAGPTSSFMNGAGHYLVKARSYFCGDANGDDIVDAGDAVAIISYIFRDGAEPVYGYCHGDTNSDGLTNIGDVVYLIAYIFRGGPPPVDECCE
jgi:hypothetical protein